MWQLAHRFEPRAVAVADRHYSRQQPGTPQCMKPGRAIVLYAARATREAMWGTTYQRPELVKHDWPDAWECSYFRNERVARPSKLILQAVAVTRWLWGEPPARGMLTFVDAAKVRAKADPGHCFMLAGFELVGATQGGLLAFLLAPERMPPAQPPLGASLRLFDRAAA